MADHDCIIKINRSDTIRAANSNKPVGCCARPRHLRQAAADLEVTAYEFAAQNAPGTLFHLLATAVELETLADQIETDCCKS